MAKHITNEPMAVALRKAAQEWAAALVAPSTDPQDRPFKLADLKLQQAARKFAKAHPAWKTNKPFHKGIRFSPFASCCEQRA